MENYFNLRWRVELLTIGNNGSEHYIVGEKQQGFSSFVARMTKLLTDIGNREDEEEAAHILDDVIAQAERYAAVLRGMRHTLYPNPDEKRPAEQKEEAVIKTG